MASSSTTLKLCATMPSSMALAKISGPALLMNVEHTTITNEMKILKR